MGNQLAQGSIVGVDVRLEELGHEVGLLGWRGGFDYLVALLVVLAILGYAVVACACTVLVAGFSSQETSNRLLLCFQGLGQVVQEWVESGVKGDVVENREDQEDDHEDDGSDCGSDTEESDETNFSDVDAS